MKCKYIGEEPKCGLYNFKDEEGVLPVPLTTILGHRVAVDPKYKTAMCEGELFTPEQRSKLCPHYGFLERERVKSVEQPSGDFSN